MSAQLKYGEKKSPISGASRLGVSGSGTSFKGRATTTGTFTGRCKGLKGYTFDYGAPGHPELYRKSKEVLLDYVRVECKEGDAVAESILGRVAAYPSKPTDPPAGASRTDEEILLGRWLDTLMPRPTLTRGSNRRTR